MQETIKDWAAWLSLKSLVARSRGIWELGKLSAVHPTKQASDCAIDALLSGASSTVAVMPVSSGGRCVQKFFGWVSGKKVRRGVVDFPTFIVGSKDR